ncbi:Transcription factor bHLH47 like [Actinidia chinensis var. chinensis]|uniref:Transcription factor bHLH47 like n=1 Tax=Actinidia chinensis var. chinensis TaxID=1590841 RepID=A0A2R6QH07_ACTCC|nr:Transcription factor bHLH47 like [Actinidia chinensis var. chinensis]
MDSEVPAAPVVDKVSQLEETSIDGSHSVKKNQGKVPKRIHKSEREKLKREHLNELFLTLANSLGPSQQNNGKASILGETTRFLKEMHTQIECLKRENATLLSESQYLTIEKNELQDENTALEAQIGKLRIEIDERVVHSKPDLNVPPQEEPTSHFLVEPVLQQAPYVNPVYVIPVRSDLPAYPEHETTQLARRPTSNVSKPHARYPNASDSWPTQLLEKQPEISKQL